MKENSKFKIFINFDKFVTSTYEYLTNSLNLNDYLYIGGIKNIAIISKKFKMSKGLNGAIQKVKFNFRLNETNGIILKKLGYFQQRF